MTLSEIEDVARSAAQQAGRVGGRLRLDYWKLEGAGLSESQIWQLKYKLADLADLVDWGEPNH